MFRHLILGIGVFMVGLFIIMSIFNLQLINLSEVEDEFIIKEVNNRNLEQKIIAEFDWQQEIDDDYITDKAKELGMVFPQFNQWINNATVFSYDDPLFSAEPIDNNSYLENYEMVESSLKQDSEIKKDSTQNKVSILIKPGMQAREIAWLLEEKGLIADANSFILLLNKLDLENKMKAGSYQISTDISSFELLLQLI